MAYTQNPYMPKVRRDAAAMVHKGYSPTEVGRRFGVGSSTICKWVKKAQKIGLHAIPTKSSRPKHHPRELADETVRQIVATRLKNGLCRGSTQTTRKRWGNGEFEFSQTDTRSSSPRQKTESLETLAS